MESSSRATYEYMIPESTSMPGTSKGDFKTANFKLGTEGPDYITTNNQNLLGA
jgi:hypothetical protein